MGFRTYVVAAAVAVSVGAGCHREMTKVAPGVKDVANGLRIEPGQ
jgi:hypothetical protein